VDIPVTDPPVIATLFAACVAIVPSPKEVLAVAPDSVTKLEPSPTIKLLSVGVNPAISANCASYA
jgi:hypothetical protein